MEIAVTDEFLKICSEILSEEKTAEEWKEVESDDMFQTQSFSGGYDATESAFCFSYFDEKNEEFWFQLTFDEISEILKKQKRSISIWPAE